MSGLEKVPVLNNFFIKDTTSTLYTYYGKVVQNVGLVLFVASVGFIAGPSFFKDLKKNAKSYDLTFNIWCTSRDSNPGPTD